MVILRTELLIFKLYYIVPDVNAYTKNQEINKL